STHCAADNPNRPPGQGEGVQIRVIAGPALRALCLPVAFQPTHDIAIRVQHTYIWNGFGEAQPLLPACLAKQRVGIAYGRSFRGLVVENWRGAHVSVQKEGREGMSSINRHAHWQNLYTTKGEKEVSWFQDRPAMSLELIAASGAGPGSAIVDIG